MSVDLEFGIVGLGKMGAGLALQALEKGLRVVGYRAKGAPAELVRAGLVEIRELMEFRQCLGRPRVILVYVPAGPAIDGVLAELLPWLEPGDVVADGGNSYWRDSVERQRRLLNQGLHFVDLGTSGGVQGARCGAAFMAGGAQEAIERIEPVLRRLSASGGYVHAGPPGAGHFAKLVQNGIGYGVFQAVAEGVDLLERFTGELDVAGILDCWRSGASPAVRQTTRTHHKMMNPVPGWRQQRSHRGPKPGRQMCEDPLIPISDTALTWEVWRLPAAGIRRVGETLSGGLLPARHDGLREHASAAFRHSRQGHPGGRGATHDPGLHDVRADQLLRRLTRRRGDGRDGVHQGVDPARGPHDPDDRVARWTGGDGLFDGRGRRGQVRWQVPGTVQLGGLFQRRVLSGGDREGPPLQALNLTARREIAAKITNPSHLG